MNISNPYTGERRAGTVGFPLPGVSTRIVDEHGTEVGAGEVGELWLRGPNVFSGYWRNDAATAAAFSDGWFRTGDIAERAADGYITLRGRRSDLIISGGFNIYPREIEEALRELCGVREAAVVGVGDARRGEVPVAYVVADEVIDPAAMEATCRTGPGVVQGAARVRPGGCAAAHRARQGAETPAPAVDRPALMSPALLSLLALVAALVVSMTSRVNVGLDRHRVGLGHRRLRGRTCGPTR